MSIIREDETVLRAQQGIDRLTAVREQLVGENRVQPAARTEILAALRGDTEAMEDLAIAWLLREDEARGLLEACSIEKTTRSVAAIEKAIRRRVATLNKARLRLVEFDDTAPGIRDAFDAPASWPNYQVPAGYEARAGGVVHLIETQGGIHEEWVATEPIYVIGVRVDIGTGSEHLVLGFRRHGAWRQITIPRNKDTKHLVALGVAGLPVSSANVRALVGWIDACETAGNRTIPVHKCTTRLGWHDGDIYIAGPGGALELDDPNGDRAGWTPSGTLDGWRMAVDKVMHLPAPVLMLYAGAAAVCLRWLKLGHNPIVDLSGPPGRGKTTSIAVPGSCWGRPDVMQGGAIITWDATATNAERVAGACWDVPVLMDETKRIAKKELVGAMLYAIAQGRGKGRGKPDGVRATTTWRNVTISTGEAPLVEVTEAGGARARVLSLEFSPAIQNREMGMELEAQLAIHHGHVGPLLAAKALEYGPRLRELYQGHMAAWAGTCKTADTRLLSTVACIELGAMLCDDVGVPEARCDWRRHLQSALELSVELNNQSGRALQIVADDLYRHIDQYQSKDTDKMPAGGWRGVCLPTSDWIGIFPSVLKEILERAGHDVTPVVRRWREERVLRCHSGGQYVARVGKISRKVYAIRKSYLGIDAVPPPDTQDDVDLEEQETVFDYGMPEGMQGEE